MRSINWNNVEAKADGDFKQLAPGPYVARIVRADDKPDKEYVEIVFDIAEGANAGFYSDDWGKSHPYAHHFFMSYKETALGMLKGRMEAIAASNPGFDPFAAWDAGRVEMFEGRLVGINLQEEEYEGSDGEIRTRLNVCQVVDAAKVRSGEIKPREIKKLGGKQPSKGAPKPSKVYTGEIPFD